MTRPSKGDASSAPFPKGYFSAPFERFAGDDRSDWASAFTLLGTRYQFQHLTTALECHTDTMETYFDSRIDLLQRQLQKHSDRLKIRAERFRIRNLSGDSLSKNEIKYFKLKVCHSTSEVAASVLNKSRHSFNHV
jgi:hypothetical protein